MKIPFIDFSVKPGEIDSLLVARESTFDSARAMNERLEAATERWIYQAIEKGAGWDVWRSEMQTKPNDHFVMTWQFALVQRDAPPPGAGIIFRQPDLTDGERARLLARRHDWREDAWEDECGVADCPHRCCAIYHGEDPKGKI